MKDIDLVKITPSPRQIKQHELEFYAFFHFTINTYTGNEWGDGTEDPKIFNPTDFSAKQWVDSIKAAGMKGAVLTCKHHDGFCLWNSEHNTHNIGASPYKNGQGDIVKELADECKLQGIKFGVYLSPWDRNSTLYGYSDKYNDYFIAQLTELLTNYGEIFCVWFDGACGEGENGKKQVYDWDRYYKLIRELQPNACITVCGPDVRWCGNEAGKTRFAEWSVVPSRLSTAERIGEKSQQSDSEEFRLRGITSTDEDLGSREILKDESELIFYPCEVDVSIRPGWFYHEDEDGKVKSVDKLLSIYYNSVGANSLLLLNIPPDKRGLIHENDRKILAEMGEYLTKTFNENLLSKAKLTANDTDSTHVIENVAIDSYDTFYKANDYVSKVIITAQFAELTEISHVVLKENINFSQRIESFEIYADINGVDTKVYNNTVVGYKRIAKFDKVETSKITIKITDSRVCPTLSFIGIY